MRRVVKNPRVWFPGMQVVGISHPSGRAYKLYRLAHPELTFPAPRPNHYLGTLISNEYTVNTKYIYNFMVRYKNPSYVVLCDDGKTRRFQHLKKQRSTLTLSL